MTILLTDASIALFLRLADDAGNWGGTPMIGEGSNVATTKEERGNLTQLKRAGLITTFKDDGNDFVAFTPAGVEYAAKNNIDVNG